MQMQIGTPLKPPLQHHQFSTGYKLPDDGERQYQLLLQENMKLREMTRQRTQISQPTKSIYTPQEMQRMSQAILTGSQKTPPNDTIIIEKICPYMTSQKGSLLAYNLIQQNRFLQNKIAQLKKEYEKQSRKIEKYSEKARQQSGCLKECYEKRYYELLRITSPN